MIPVRQIEGAGSQLHQQRVRPTRSRSSPALLISALAMPLLFGLLVLLVWETGANLGLENAAPSPRYVLHAIPTAVSMILGLGGDYRADKQISAKFTSEPLPPGGLNELIARVLADPPQNP